MQRYPLSWPEGWKRTQPAFRARAKFSKGERQYSSTPGVSSWLEARYIAALQPPLNRKGVPR